MQKEKDKGDLDVTKMQEKIRYLQLKNELLEIDSQQKKKQTTNLRFST